MQEKKARSNTVVAEAREITFQIIVVSQMAPIGGKNRCKVTLTARSLEYLDLWAAMKDQGNICTISEIMPQPDEVFLQIVGEKTTCNIMYLLVLLKQLGGDGFLEPLPRTKTRDSSDAPLILYLAKIYERDHYRELIDRLSIKSEFTNIIA